MKKTVDSLNEIYQLSSGVRDAGKLVTTDKDKYAYRKKEVCAYLSALIASGLILVIIELSASVNNISATKALPESVKASRVNVATYYTLLLYSML